jgi:hypothetical protein
MRSGPTGRHRPFAAFLLAAFLLAAAAVVFAACTAPGATTSPAPGTGSPAPLPSSTSTPSGSTPIPTTVTDWGPILDAAPLDFPRYPGTQQAIPEGPTSATLTSGAGVAAVVAWYDTAMPAARFDRATSSGPDESGSIVTEYDGSRRAPGCRAQVTVRPQGGQALIVVLVGAACRAAGS